MDIDLLKQVPLLSALPEGELSLLASTLSVVDIGAGNILFREGEQGESLYIIVEGKVDVIVGLGLPDEKVIAVLGPGECIGEMGLLLPGGLRTASIRAAGPTRLWVMIRADFDALLHRQPTMAYSIALILSKRLDSTTMSSFRDLQEKNRLLQKAYDELKAAQAQIIEKERLERELQVAAEIQISILPHELPRSEWYDIGACMVPARMVGGDFYDVFKLDKQRVGVVIGDVADKGIPSAIFMARTHALIAAEMFHGGSPGDVLRRVNAHLIKLEEAELFVTVLLGILDCRTGEFAYARAGHESPLLLSADGKVEIPQRRPGQPVGVFDDILLDDRNITLPPGSTLLLFTDGMTDGRDPRGELFGLQRLQQTLTGLSGQNAQQVCDRLLQSLRIFQADAPQDDDITLLAVHFSNKLL